MTITAYYNLRTGSIFSTQGGPSYLGGRETCGGNPPPDALEFQRGDTPTLRLLAFDPHDDNEAVLLPTDTLLRAALKPWNDHTSGALLAAISNDDWDKPATLDDNVQADLLGDPGGFYTALLDLRGDALDALLPAGTGAVYCHLQIQTETATGVFLSSQWIPVLIRSDVVRTADGSVTISTQPSPSAAPYYKDITALTGGDDSLDAIPTIGKTKILALLYLDDQLQTWRLFDGTTAEDSANGIVRPDDYNASTNAQVWKRIA